jgi:hypothetical protein
MLRKNRIFFFAVIRLPCTMHGKTHFLQRLNNVGRSEKVVALGYLRMRIIGKGGGNFLLEQGDFHLSFSTLLVGCF